MLSWNIESMDNFEYMNYLQKQYLECKLCLNPLRKPKLLPCQHAFCRDCIAKHIDSNSFDGKNSFECPTCSASHPKPENGNLDSLPSAVVLKSMLETMNLMQKKEVACTRCNKDKIAQSACSTCGDLLCNQCEFSHKVDDVTKEHMLLILEELSHVGKLEDFQKIRYNACRNHVYEKCAFYCSNDGEQVCVKCKSEPTHDGHKVVKIEYELHQLKSASGSLVLDMRNHTKALQRQKQTLEETLSKITQEQTQFLERIAQNYAHITGKLQSYYNFIVSEVTEGAGKQQELLRTKIDKLRTITDYQEELVFRSLLQETLPIPIALWVAQELGTSEMELSYNDVMTEDQIRQACPGIRAIVSTFDFQHVDDFLRPVASYLIGKRDDSCQIM